MYLWEMFYYIGYNTVVYANHQNVRWAIHVGDLSHSLWSIHSKTHINWKSVGLELFFKNQVNQNYFFCLRIKLTKNSKDFPLQPFNLRFTWTIFLIQMVFNPHGFRMCRWKWMAWIANVDRRSCIFMGRRNSYFTPNV